MFDIKYYKEKINLQKPLILNLVNYVSMQWIADILLALGASPVMSMNYEDSLELLENADALNINIGTLDPYFNTLTTRIAIRNNKNKPTILDPAGAGASSLRTNTVISLLPLVNVLRGNGSEILSLDSSTRNTKGVDSSIPASKACSTATAVAQKYNITVTISGAEDFIINNKYISSIECGHPIMSQITGMGCVLSAVTAAFCAVEHDFFIASQLAAVYVGCCGELAAQQSSLGTFKNYFIDQIHTPNYDYIQNKLSKISSNDREH
ncbi:MAG: hydroxyethylthiazole kinase [Brevinemataceae bacterium]